MTSQKVNVYLDVLGETPQYKNLFSVANALYKKQLIFTKLIPEKLSPYCYLGKLNDNELTIIVKNSAVAAKLKQFSPSLLYKLQKIGWKITSIHVLVQGDFFRDNIYSHEKQLHTKKQIFNQVAQDSFHELIIASNDSPMIKAVYCLLKKHKDI
jgi:hypothetical protein